MHLRLFAVLALLSLSGCSGGSGASGQTAATILPAQQAAPVTTLAVAPSPSPSPDTSTAIPINDSLVLDAAVPSTDRAKYGPRTYQGVPGMARVGKRIWAVWFGDISPAKWEATGNFLILSYSDDGGRKWSREYYLVPAHPETDRTLDPRLWLAPDGKLWVLYAQSGGGFIFDGQLGAWVNVISNPLAPDPTFEPGFRLADGQAYRPFLYHGQWYVEIDYLGGAQKRFPGRQGKHIYALDWQNRTATQVSTVPRTPNADYNEPAFAELRDGRLMTQSRSYDGIYQSTSDAPGSLLFTTLSRWTFYPSIPSRHSLTRSPSGRLVMVWNKTVTGAGRKDMTIALSDDDGASWPYVYTFDARDQVSYPDVDYAANGDILVAYDRGRNGYKEIWLATINEASLQKRTPKVSIQLVNRPTL